MKKFSYLNGDGKFDYERYKKIQIEGNKQKLTQQWVDQASIEYLASVIQAEVHPVNFGICHGTRRGLEQAWFRSYLECEVIGTEISDTANQFPHTIQWDFHEVKPEWISAVDFIYSNAWDHSYDPYKLFTNWMSCVRPGGVCIIDHSPHHQQATELDPLGMSREEMIELLKQISDGSWAYERALVDAPPILANGGKKVVKTEYHLIRRLAT